MYLCSPLVLVRGELSLPRLFDVLRLSLGRQFLPMSLLFQTFGFLALFAFDNFL